MKYRPYSFNEACEHARTRSIEYASAVFIEPILDFAGTPKIVGYVVLDRNPGPYMARAYRCGVDATNSYPRY
jgi:hypothetical protein